MERPTMAIVRLKMSLDASKREPMDPDTAAFMSDLGLLAGWLDELEARTEPDIILTGGAVRLDISLARAGEKEAKRSVGPDVLSSLKPEAWPEVVQARTVDLLREAGFDIP